MNLSKTGWRSSVRTEKFDNHPKSGIYTNNSGIFVNNTERIGGLGNFFDFATNGIGSQNGRQSTQNHRLLIGRNGIVCKNYSAQRNTTTNRIVWRKIGASLQVGQGRFEGQIEDIKLTDMHSINDDFNYAILNTLDFDVFDQSTWTNLIEIFQNTSIFAGVIINLNINDTT